MSNFAIDKAERRLAFRTDEYEIYGFWVCMGWTPALQAGYQMGSIPIGSTIFADVAQSGRAFPRMGEGGGSNPSVGLLDDMRLLWFYLQMKTILLVIGDTRPALTNYV